MSRTTSATATSADPRMTPRPCAGLGDEKNGTLGCRFASLSQHKRLATPAPIIAPVALHFLDQAVQSLHGGRAAGQAANNTL